MSDNHIDMRGLFHAGIVGKQTSVKNPRQAGKVFHPKQRNTFMVRFVGGSGTDGQFSPFGQDSVSFVAKMVERPKVNLKAEELHQYNKKRQVYTGFKLDPVRMQLYDTAGGTAHKLWAAYTSYYFGDLSRPDKTDEYVNDITSQNFRSTTGNNFGFTGANGGASDIDARFFFSQVEIYHFSQDTFDRYTLVHPRIIAFDPDDLDYAESGVAMIGMTLVYEQLRFEPTIPIEHGMDGPHFSGSGNQDDIVGFEQGQPFDGEVRTVPSYGQSGVIGYGKRPAKFEQGTLQSIDRLLKEAPGKSKPLDQRYRGQAPKYSKGSLGIWGNFEFAPAVSERRYGAQGYFDVPPPDSDYPRYGVPLDSWDIGSLSLNSPQFAAAIDFGIQIGGVSVQAGFGVGFDGPRFGIDGAAYDLALGRVGGAMISNYGTASTMLTAGVLVASATLGDAPIGHLGTSPFGRPVSVGVRLRAEGYGAINARQTGTARYGYNLNTASDGTSWGYTGPSGYLGPIGPENDGPYPSDQPSGLYGRYGIIPQPISAYGVPQNLLDTSNG